jgi:2-keto-4-pentenoate hydratase
VQFEEWRATLAAGAGRVGWKLGMGDRERIGDGPVIGHLTSFTQLEPGAVFDARGVDDLRADAEIAVELGLDVEPDADEAAVRTAIAGFGAALELVDLAGTDDPEAIVAANVWHRAFALHGSRTEPPAAGVEGRLVVNGETRASALADGDLVDGVCAVARLLGAMGERLRAGDRIITGSVVQVSLAPGDEVVADLGALGRVQLAIGT